LPVAWQNTNSLREVGFCELPGIAFAAWHNMPAYALRWSLDKDAEIGFSSPRTEHMELGEQVH